MRRHGTRRLRRRPREPACATRSTPTSCSRTAGRPWTASARSCASCASASATRRRSCSCRRSSCATASATSICGTATEGAFADAEPAFREALDGLRFAATGAAEAGRAPGAARVSARSPFDDRPAIGIALVRFGLALLVLVAGIFQVQRHHAAVADARVWGLPSPSFSGIAIPVVAIVLGVILLLGIAPRLAAWLILALEAILVMIVARPHRRRLLPHAAARHHRALPDRDRRGRRALGARRPNRSAAPAAARTLAVTVVLRLDIEYDGAAFYGWAAQPGLRTVEGVLTDALRVFWPHSGRPAVAGAPTRACTPPAQVVRVDGAEGGPESRASGGAQCAPAVRMSPCCAAARAPEGFHARFSALSPRYEYRVLRHARPSPLRAARTWHWPRDGLPRGALGAVRAVIARGARLPRLHARGDAARRSSAASCWPRSGSGAATSCCFAVEADSFLRHMVRTLVGTMLQTAAGRAAAGGLRDACSRARSAQRRASRRRRTRSASWPCVRGRSVELIRKSSYDNTN